MSPSKKAAPPAQRQVRVVVPEDVWPDLNRYAKRAGFESPASAAKDLIREALIWRRTGRAPGREEAAK